MSSVFKIEEIGKVLTGKTPKTSVPEFWDGVLPFYTPSDMDGRRRLDEVKRYITEDGLKTVKNSAIPPNSVMVSCIGSDMGKVSLSVKHGVTNQQINTIICTSIIHCFPASQNCNCLRLAVLRNRS